MPNYTLEIIDENDGRDWYAVIYAGDEQVWCSNSQLSRRDALSLGEQSLAAFQRSQEGDD